MSEDIEFIKNELIGLEGIGIKICNTCQKPTKILLSCNKCKDNFCLRCVKSHNHIEEKDEEIKEGGDDLD